MQRRRRPVAAALVLAAVLLGTTLAAQAIGSGELALTAQELPGLLNPEWSLAGPANVGGRVTDIAPDPTQPGRVFVGVSTAGVWKSEDGGVGLPTSQCRRRSRRCPPATAPFSRTSSSESRPRSHAPHSR